MWAHDQNVTANDCGEWRCHCEEVGTTHWRRHNKFILTALFGQRRQIRGERRGRPPENELPLWHVSKTIAAHALQIPAAAAVSSAAVGMHPSRTTASKYIHLFRAPPRNHTVLLSFSPRLVFFYSPSHPLCLLFLPSRWNLREWHGFSEVENKYRLAVAPLDGLHYSWRPQKPRDGMEGLVSPSYPPRSVKAPFF